MNRDDFLSHVRQAAQQGRAYRVATNDSPAGTGYVGIDADPCDAMASGVEEAGGIATVVENWDAARHWLESTLEKHAVTSALCWQHPKLEQIGLSDVLSSRKIDAYSFSHLSTLPTDEQRQLMFAADIGISSADYAVAETGTLVVCSQPGHERVASLLPPVHIAVISSQQIVPDLIDAFDDIGKSPTDLPSNISLITGPSKTGDIELQLTTGVHGPGTWYVLIVRE